jgi:hypothetical protein
VSECPGAPDVSNSAPHFPHRWISTMTLPVDASRAENWKEVEGDLAPGVLPRSTNVVCILCGEPAEGAPDECSERRFWLAGDAPGVPDFVPDDLESTEAGEPADLSAPVGFKSVTLRRGACFGRCPEYEVRLSADGTASWLGMSFVEPLGRHEAQVDQADVARLAKLLDRSRFASWRDEYVEPITDLPRYELIVEHAGGEKRVVQYASEEPPDFWVIATVIDGIVARVDWQPRSVD